MPTPESVAAFDKPVAARTQLNDLSRDITDALKRRDNDSVLPGIADPMG
jgi:hypothetical protein